MDGKAAQQSLIELYDVAGAIRHAFVALQCKVMASQGTPLRDDCPAAASGKPF